MTKFEAGKTYTATESGETRDFESRFEIIKRTAKTVTYIETAWTGETKEAATKRIKVENGTETFQPHGAGWWTVTVKAA